jgi:hypothetical protein
VAPSNVRCEAAQALVNRELQTVLVDSQCRTPELDPYDPELRYFALDLSSEVSKVVVQASAWSFAAAGLGRTFNWIAVHRADLDGSCVAEVTSGELRAESPGGADVELTAALEPGRYVLELNSAPPVAGDVAGPGALTVRLDREACKNGPIGDTCETALELDPRAPIQIVSGTTACNTDRVRIPACNDVASADQFFRLDLRDRATRTRARLSVPVDGIGLRPLLSLLAEDGNGGCGRSLYCYDSISDYEGPPHYDLSLDPALYFIGIESITAGSAGAYHLVIELEPSEASACVTSRIDDCVYREELARCCFDSLDPGCRDVIQVCGLATETQACVCDRDPACCGGGGDISGCASVFADCHYLCEDFAPSSLSCLNAFR